MCFLYRLKSEVTLEKYLYEIYELGQLICSFKKIDVKVNLNILFNEAIFFLFFFFLKSLCNYRLKKMQFLPPPVPLSLLEKKCLYLFTLYSVRLKI